MISRRTRRLLRSVAIYCACLIVAFLLVAPFLWMVISSISLQKELTVFPPHWFPQEPTLANYAALLTSGASRSIASTEFARSLWNSTVVSLLTTAFALVIGVPSSYAFARLKFHGQRGLFLLIILAQMLPSIALIIPLYLLISAMGLSNTIPGLVLVYTSFTLPFVVWVMTGYFQTIPKELEEAAMIDGAGRLVVVLRIVLPIALPGVVAATIFSLLNAWSEFFLAVVFTSTETAKTMPVVISEFAGRFSIDYGAMNAAAVLGSLPPILFALVLQKYIVSGLTAGAVKG